MRFDEHSTIQLTAAVDRDRTTVTAIASVRSPEQSWSVNVEGHEVSLRMEVKEPLPGPNPRFGGADRITLSAWTPGSEPVTMTELDGRHWSVESAAPFTGRILGMVAQGGEVLFKSFYSWATAAHNTHTSTRSWRTR